MTTPARESSPAPRDGIAELLAGRDDAGPKTFTTGTHRLCSPEATLEKLAPHLRELGITRLADITGLDRIGIPVAMACRPNSRSVAVAQGKGPTCAAARASALMEALETYQAERAYPPTVHAAWRDLDCALDPKRLPLCPASEFHEGLVRRWVAGVDLADGARRYVPFELVHTDYTLPGPEPGDCFAANTNGLASGNHVLEAAVHALAEVVERDALTLWQLRSRAAQIASIVAPDTIDDPLCVQLLGRFAEAGVRVLIWDVTSDIRIPVFHVLIMDTDAHGAAPEFGSGCHPNRAVALARALTEAAQARLTFIAGSRDDFDPAAYDAAARAARLSHCRRLFECRSTMGDFSTIPGHDARSLRDDLRWMLARLRDAGLEQAVVVDLGGPVADTSVVRVLVPGLEGPLRGANDDYVPGARARRIAR